MKDHDNFDLFEKITKKSSPLFVKGGDIISRNPLVAGYHEIDTEELIRTYRGNGYSDSLIEILSYIAYIITLYVSLSY